MKRTLALVLALALCLSMFALAGCSKAGSGDNGSASGSDNSSDNSTGDTIKIGYIGPLTGSVSVYGIAVQRGVQLAIKEINAAGGLLGKQVELVCKDDQGTETEALNAFNELVSAGVKIIVGAVTTNCTSAITSAANNEKVVLISASSTADSITTEDDYIFRTCYSDSFQGAIAAAYCYLNNITKVGVVYCAADPYSKGMYDSFKAACDGYNIEVAAVESTDAMEAVDFSNQFQGMINAGVDVVFAPYYYSTVGPYLVPQAREAGYEGIILGSDGYDGAIGYISDGDGAYFENVYFTNHYDPASDSETVKNFVAAYQAEYDGETPNAFAALAYDAGTVLKEAITKAGTTDPTAVRDTMADTSTVYTCVTGTFTFDQSGTPLKGGVITSFTYDESSNTVGTKLIQAITELP